jgi:hypothetical protein
MSLLDQQAVVVILVVRLVQVLDTLVAEQVLVQVEQTLVHMADHIEQCLCTGRFLCGTYGHQFRAQVGHLQNHNHSVEVQVVELALVVLDTLVVELALVVPDTLVVEQVLVAHIQEQQEQVAKLVAAQQQVQEVH